jgi:hypothetical protein
VARYLDHAGLDQGWLVLFDLCKEVPWVDRLFVREAEQGGKRSRSWGVSPPHRL